MSKKETGKMKKEPLQTPKGMRDIIDDEYYAYQGLYEKAAEIAIYYGFKPIQTPILEKEEVFTSSVGEGTDIVDKEMYTLRTKGGDKLALRPEGTAGVVRAYIEQGMQSWPQPVMLYYYGPFFRHENPQKGRLREFRQFGVEILGTQKSVADAIVIRTLDTILKEAGFKNTVVEINSIGDKDCRPAYTRELIAHYRKHVNTLCANCRQRLKVNPMRLLDCKNTKCQAIKETAPQPMSLLCNGCRQHFKEVLEYLEAMDIAYRVNPHLVRGLNYYTKTVFEIIEEDGVNTEESESKQKEDAKDTEEGDASTLTIASGGRYDYLAKQLGSKKDVSSVGGSIGVDRVLMSPSYKRLDPRILKKPKIYFIQLGFEAKLKSLTIIEILRKSRTPIAQSLAKDSLAGQLAVAEKLKIPYTIIFGQKEALDGTVIIRNMESRSQETIKIADLAEHIKKLK